MTLFIVKKIGLAIFVTNEKVQIEVQAQSAGLLSLFTQSLNEYREVEGVSIDRVQNKTASSLVIVSITAQLKN